MSPAVKYTLARIGLFLVIALALWPVNANIFLKLMLAVIFSAALAYFLLRGWRDEMAQQLATGAARRKAERERLRSALAGEDQVDRPAPPAGPNPAVGPIPPVEPDEPRRSGPPNRPADPPNGKMV